MRRLMIRVLALFAAVALSTSAGAAENLSTQANSQSGVTVKVTPRSVAGTSWEFEIVFDTHSQDLKDDLLQNAVLLADGGARTAPTGWQGDPPGGHHRKGVLRFDAVTPSPANFELRIQRTGEAGPRVFRWKLR